MWRSSSASARRPPKGQEGTPAYFRGDAYPIKTMPGFADMQGYFNLDNGSGKIRGIYTEGNFAVTPIFKDVARPLRLAGRRQRGGLAHRLDRPRGHGAAGPSGLPVHPGPARLREPHPPHRPRHLRPPARRRPAPGCGDHGDHAAWTPRSPTVRSPATSCRPSLARPTRSATASRPAIAGALGVRRSELAAAPSLRRPAAHLRGGVDGEGCGASGPGPEQIGVTVSARLGRSARSLNRRPGARGLVSSLRPDSRRRHALR